MARAERVREGVDSEVLEVAQAGPRGARWVEVRLWVCSEDMGAIEGLGAEECHDHCDE